MVYVDQDQRRIFGRDHFVGYPPSFTHMSPSPTRAYPPAPSLHMAGPSRRPLPTPRPRPESMPPPLRQSPLIVQAPAPFRPAILAPAALAMSPTVPPARRPLPTPTLSPSRPVTKHASLDLTARPASPVKNVINTNPDRDLRLPTSFSRRTAPLPDPTQHPSPTAFSTPPTWSRSTRSESHHTHESKLAPLSGHKLHVVSSPQIGPTVIERRSTVSGVFPPTVLPLRPDPRPPENLEHAQPLHRFQASPPRRPLPSSPTEPPRVSSFHQRVPAFLEDDQDTSSPSPSDLSSLSDDDTYQPMTFADPIPEDDDGRGITFTRNVHTPSPKYGIRDLPSRPRISVATRDYINTTASKDVITRSRQKRSATLPQPPTDLPRIQSQTDGLPQSPHALSSTVSELSNRSPVSGPPTAEPQSLTLRFASMELAEERQRERQRQTPPTVPSSPLTHSPTRAALPTSPVRQQGWSTNIPPLPRAPGNASRPLFGTTDLTLQRQSSKPDGTASSPASLPTSPTHPARPFSSSPNTNVAFDRKSFAQPSSRQTTNMLSQQIPQLSDRQLQKQKAREPDIDLDDAPPPSLRRSPSPNRQGFTRTPTIEITNDTPPRRQWTPGQDVTLRMGNGSGNGAISPHVGLDTGSQSPERRGKSLSQTVVRSPTQSQPTVVPRILLPDDRHDSDRDYDDNPLSPSIVVSRPGSGQASISASDMPAISISGPVAQHGAPVIAVSSADAPSITFSPPTTSVSDSNQSQRPGPSGGFGSRHTQIQEIVPLNSAPSRGPGSKRGLPSPPSSSGPGRSNGLSCGGCNGPIIGRIVSAMGQRWHPDCFKCTICNELLEHVSSYEHDGRPYCHLDYHETFAPRCFHCKTAIIDERFITLDDPALGKRTYHEQHFFCAECGDPFLAPSAPLPSSVARTGELNVSGDGEFMDDDVGFTVYKGHPYCEACHVRLRMPKCKACKKSIRDGVRAVEALGGKWCWGCFVCEGCKKPFEDPSFFLRDEKPFCEACFSLILRNEV